MLTGPVEAVLEKEIEVGLNLLKDLVRKMRSILTPFMADLKSSETSEDKSMDDRDAQLNVSLRGCPCQRGASAMPAPCPRHLIIMERRTKSLSVCQKHLKNAQMSGQMEGDVNDVVNITDSLDDELQANLHMLLVEMPRLENVVLKTASKVVQALFIFFVYTIFRDAVKMIENYKTDVDFNNRFITGVFWQIDHHRELLGQQAIRYISKAEMREWNERNFSPPTRGELNQARFALMTWFVAAFVAALLIFMDYYLYAFLNAVSVHHKRRSRASAL
ncbi:unnamed protein product [Cylicostephanus goldi]|uniref:Dendritic cell-specific transmembrane protein-like domain-containing protein n=1 Tax=Cylicostephanus goldi TaxID=71465 RepID=A0A3P6QE77_CYLGO|nr:unnamed protein product [Cylicostephanus goldi]